MVTEDLFTKVGVLTVTDILVCVASSVVIKHVYISCVTLFTLSLTLGISCGIILFNLVYLTPFSGLGHPWQYQMENK